MTCATHRRVSTAAPRTRNASVRSLRVYWLLKGNIYLNIHQKQQSLIVSTKNTDLTKGWDSFFFYSSPSSSSGSSVGSVGASSFFPFEFVFNSPQTIRGPASPPGCDTPSSLSLWIIKDVPFSLSMDFLPSNRVASASINSLSTFPLPSASTFGKSPK